MLSSLRIPALLLLAGLMAVPGQAQNAGSFARLGFGARGLAMSNALVADAFGHASPYYNPALAPFTAGQHLEASAALMSLDRELQFLQFATPLQPRAGVAAGLIRAGVSGIDGRDFSGYHTQELSTDEFAFFLAFGIRIGERVTIGTALQLFRSDYLEALSAVNTLGIDLGLTVRVTDNLILGLTADDLLARYTWDTSSVFADAGRSTTDAFPRRLRLGAAYQFLQGRARVTGEYEAQFVTREGRTVRVDIVDGLPRRAVDTEDFTIRSNALRVGAEIDLIESFALRAGVGQGSSEETAVAPTAGFMIEQPVGALTARAEYAAKAEPYGAGILHLITLRVFL
ncbi:MAG: hypothetical protein AAGI71_06745 [Bacteroidota bacterium]